MGPVVNRVTAWSWESPTPQGNNLRGLWATPGATGVDDLFLVGESGTLLTRSRGAFARESGEGTSSEAILAVAGSGSGAQRLVMAVGAYDFVATRSGDDPQWQPAPCLPSTTWSAPAGACSTCAAGLGRVRRRA
jgi:hypothetical protein